MKQIQLRSLCIILCLALCVMVSGCGASMFTSEHKHYHGTKEIDQRLDNLEQRVSHLEAMHPQGHEHMD